MVLEMGFLLVPLVLLYDFIKMWKNAIEKNWKFKMSGYFCFRPYVYDSAVGFDFPDSYEGR